MPPTTSPDAVAERVLDGLSPRILIVGLTSGPDGSIACLHGVGYPAPSQPQVMQVYGGDSATTRNAIARFAIDNDFAYLFMVDDDTFPPSSALIRLHQLIRGNKKVIAGAHYVKRIPGLKTTEPTSWIATDAEGPLPAEAIPLTPDGTVQECLVLATGCIAIPVRAFKDIPEPWFSWDGGVSDDVHFSQLAREAGWTLLCATDVRCRHVDRITGETFE